MHHKQVKKGTISRKTAILKTDFVNLETVQFCSFQGGLITFWKHGAEKLQKDTAAIPAKIERKGGVFTSQVGKKNNLAVHES